MPSCVGAPAAGAFVRELTGDFSGAERAVRMSSSGSLNAAFCGYGCGGGRGVYSVPNKYFVLFVGMQKVMHNAGPTPRHEGLGSISLHIESSH